MFRSMCPCRAWRFKRHTIAVLRVRERQLGSVQAEWFIFNCEGLQFAELVIGKVHRIADDGPAEVPEVDSDLIRSSGSWRDA